MKKSSRSTLNYEVIVPHMLKEVIWARSELAKCKLTLRPGAGPVQAPRTCNCSKLCVMCRATAVGKISDIVDSDSGYHIIYRIE